MQDLRLICICKQKTFPPVLSINSSQKDKALPVKTSKPNFVTFFMYFRNSLLRLVVELRQQTGKAFCSQLTRVWRRSLGGTGGESVNSAGYSLSSSSQSERPKNAFHCFSIY